MNNVFDMVDAASDICEKLQNAGYEAVFAGGVVRDLLLGVAPKDIDIATSATPDQVEALFPKTVAVGKAFGVIRVINEDGEQFEVVTFREDSSDSDGRRPNNVTFSSMETDARRRDLTINALFLDPIAEKIYDFVGGQADIKARKVRFVGNPQQRIDEDKLRMLRVIRFSSKGGWRVEEDTRTAVIRNAALIREVSAERIGDELTKIFASDTAHIGLNSLRESGLWSWCHLPALSKFAEVGYALEKGAMNLKENPHLAWALILLYSPAPADTLAALRFSKEFSNKVLNLIATYANAQTANKLTSVERSRLLANADFLNIVRFVEYNGHHDAAKYLLQVKISTPANQINPDKLVDGSDLIKLGEKPSKFFRQVLAAVENEQRAGKITDRESALLYVQSLLEQRDRDAADTASKNN